MKQYLFLLLILGCGVNVLVAQSSEEYFASAMSFKQKDNYIETARLLNKAIELDRTNIELKKELANAQYINKKFYEAIPIYEELIRNDEKDLLYLSRLAEMYSMSSQKMKAVEYAERVLKLKPSDPQVFKMLARTFYEVKHYPKAIELYLVAEKSLAKDMDIPYKLGFCYRKLSKNYEAMQYYIKAMQLDENNSNKIYEAANSCYDANNFKLAIELYQKAEVKGYFKSKSFYDNWALAYTEMKNYEQALQCYMKAKDFSPFDKNINLSIADTYMKMGEFNKSRDVLDEMLKINPKDADVIYTKGMTYYKAGNTGKAESFFNYAFELDPSLKSLRYAKSNF